MTHPLRHRTRVGSARRDLLAIGERREEMETLRLARVWAIFRVSICASALRDSIFSRPALAAFAFASHVRKKQPLFRVTEANCNLAGTCRCI